KLNSLIATEENAHLPIHNLSTFFRYSESAMEFYNLQAKIGQSFVSDTLVFKYNGTAELSDFNNKVNIKATLKNSVIHPDDIAKFASGTQLFDQPITLNGNITGKISRLTYQQMDIRVGQTELKGKLELDGLPAINETFISLSIRNGNVNIRDLKFLFTDPVYDRIQTLGKFRLTGKFTGFTNDFVANGDFRGDFGQIKSDINLKIDQVMIDRSEYDGNLQLTNFNLGQFFRDTSTFQFVTLKGNIKGKGLTQETADFNLSGTISSIGILKYEYQNIITDARFAKELFIGKIDINDPNLQLNAVGSLNIRPGYEVIKISARLDTLHADKLGLVNKSLFVSSNIDIDTKGLELDSLFGKIVLRNAFVNYEDETLSLDSININSFMDEDNLRNLRLSSSFADVTLKGNFYYSTLFKDIQKFVYEFKLNARNNKDELLQYYASKPREARDYITSFTIELNHINPVLKLLRTGVTVSDNTLIDGKFFNGYTIGLQAYSEIDSVSYSGKYFLGNELEFSGSKISDSTIVLAMLTLNSKKQIISSSLATTNLFSEAIWDKDHIDFNIDFEQEKTTNYLKLKSEIDFLSDSTKIRILPTTIKILEKEWSINQSNYILNNGREWMVYQLGLRHDNETILLDGKLSDNPDESLQLYFNNLNLDVLNSLGTSKFSGVVNGNIQAKDVYDKFFLQNDLTIKDFEVDNFLIGNIYGTNIWNQEEKRFDIHFTIDRLEKRTLTLEGYYNPDNSNPLKVSAVLEKTNIKIIEPFLKGIFSQMDGTLSGFYNIEGSLAAPRIQGDGKIEDGKIMIDYLKTLYSFSGKLRMTPDKIIFEDFDMLDAFKNKGYLDGYLTHRNFDRFRINLDAVFTNFQVMNTTQKDNSLFYGQAYSTGKLNILGPLDNMKISATARTSKNTKIYIPISGTESVQKSEYIRFIDLNDSTQNEQIKTKLTQTQELTGITLDLNLDITPDAYAEIIFDIVAGDIIRGYGNGDIKLQLDTKGEFNMFGLFEFESGNYNFTLYDIINKEFNIGKGSRISWYGDPYAGVMNVNANYRQLASLGPILENQVSANALSSPQIRRKYPIEVLLKLDGPMLSPQIQFDIQAKDLPESIVVEGEPAPVRLNFQFSAFKSRLDEQELKRQVFSLIVLRRFSSQDAFSTSGSIYNSVSEFLSNQLSYWLTQVDQNLEINIDLGTMDQEAFNTFQLRLSYSFLNGRLRITRDGSFSTEYAKTDVASMLGDWTIDYLLTPDGKLKVKMFSRSNFNSTTTNAYGTQTAMTTGVSLLHTQNFNKLKDLLNTSRERRKKELEENPTQEEGILEEIENNE
ncbi:MAG: translocation/assembly module TamB, partial [Cyclobacteriaceae bacterium]|nr:translocation/assembly module TamB [Cyclobacteriaceae bacterium]